MPKSKTQAKHIEESEYDLSFSEEEKQSGTEDQFHSESEGYDHEEEKQSGTEDQDHSESEGSEHEEEQAVSSPKSKTKSKLTSHDIIDKLEENRAQLGDILNDFKEETVKYRTIEKEYLSSKTKLEKEQQVLLKKLGNTVSTKSKPTKNRDPSTIGGFNKKTHVPTCLRSYLELDDDSMMSRPDVVGLLKTKFEEEGFVDSKSKEIRLSNKLLKKFGHQKGYVFKGNRYQSFLKIIYDNYKKEVLSV